MCPVASPSTTPAPTEAPDFITPAIVCELVPGMTRGNLAQMRFKGTGPRFYAPTPRTILYKRSEVLEWIEASARTITGEVDR